MVLTDCLPHVTSRVTVVKTLIGLFTVTITNVLAPTVPTTIYNQ